MSHALSAEQMRLVERVATPGGVFLQHVAAMLDGARDLS